MVVDTVSPSYKYDLLEKVKILASAISLFVNCWEPCLLGVPGVVAVAFVPQTNAFIIEVYVSRDTMPKITIPRPDVQIKCIQVGNATPIRSGGTTIT